MRKVFVSMALAVLALGSQAQVLKNDLLKGYKVGDTLEKTVYDDKRAPINVDTWCGGFTAKPVEVLLSERLCLMQGIMKRDYLLILVFHKV